MIKPVGYEHMNPAQIALFCARFQLAFLQGAIVLDTQNAKCVHSIDNLEVSNMIDAATSWLDKSDGKVTTT